MAANKLFVGKRQAEGQLWRNFTSNITTTRVNMSKVGGLIWTLGTLRYFLNKASCQRFVCSFMKVSFIIQIKDKRHRQRQERSLAVVTTFEISETLHCCWWHSYVKYGSYTGITKSVSSVMELLGHVPHAATHLFMGWGAVRDDLIVADCSLITVMSSEGPLA